MFIQTQKCIWIRLIQMSLTASLKLQPFPRREPKCCDFIQLEWSDIWLQQNHYINLLQTPPSISKWTTTATGMNFYIWVQAKSSKAQPVVTAITDVWPVKNSGSALFVPPKCRAFLLATPPVVSELATLCLPSPLLDSEKNKQIKRNNDWVISHVSSQHHNSSMLQITQWGHCAVSDLRSSLEFNYSLKAAREISHINPNRNSRWMVSTKECTL